MLSSALKPTDEQDGLLKIGSKNVEEDNTRIKPFWTRTMYLFMYVCMVVEILDLQVWSEKTEMVVLQPWKESYPH